MDSSFRALLLLLGMRETLALPLGQFFISSGYARPSCVTAWTFFSLKRVCENVLRYRLDDFFSQAGMRETLALPLEQFFLSSGYVRASRVTTWEVFSHERVCETLLCYRLDDFFSQAGMREPLALPLEQFFLSSGYVRASRVTTWEVFSHERVCETLLCYRLDDFFSQAGMRDPLALPLGQFFISSGYVRASRVTTWEVFSHKRACETLLRYRLDDFFSQAGMRDPLALPLGQFFISSGYARPSCVTAWTIFSLKRVCETLLRYRLGSFSSQAGMRDPLALPFPGVSPKFGHDGHSSVTFLMDFPRSSGMMDAPALPFSRVSPKFGYARHSPVTFPLLFPRVRARWSINRPAPLL